MMAINERKSSCEQIFHYHYIYTMKFCRLLSIYIISILIIIYVVAKT